MRTYEEYHKILSLWDTGLYNKSELSRKVGIPRATVRDCIAKFGSVQNLEEERQRNVELAGESSLLKALQNRADSENIHKAYAYVLGMYLGDGCISKANERVYKIRVTLDRKYPGIIERCVAKIQELLPDNQVNVVDQYAQKGGERYVSCHDVVCYYKYWPQVFPQDGDGMKHTRQLSLEDWQQRIVDQYPLEFFRGLYHSDGSRSQNIVKGKNYPRYFFSNRSRDIMLMYIQTCMALNLDCRFTNKAKTNIAISRRKDVEWLDKHIGAKA